MTTVCGLTKSITKPCAFEKPLWRASADPLAPFKSISGLLRLYRSFDFNDTTQVSPTISVTGSKVTQWDDESGNDYHATQSVDADRPVTSLSPDLGHASVNYTLGQHLLSDCPMPNESTTFAVFNRIGTDNTGTMPVGGVAGGLKSVIGLGLWLPNMGFDPDSVYMLQGALVDDSVIADNAGQDQTVLAYGYWGDVGENGRVFLRTATNTETGNLGTRNATTADYDGNATYALGAAKNDTSPYDINTSFGFLQGDLLFCVEYNRVLSTSEMETIEGATNNLVGIW